MAMDIRELASTGLKSPKDMNRNLVLKDSVIKNQAQSELNVSNHNRDPASGSSQPQNVMIKAVKRHSTVDQAPQSPMINSNEHSKAGHDHPFKMASEDLGKI